MKDKSDTQFNLNQISDIIEMQNKLNASVHPDWIAQNWDWTKAIYMEATEAINECGWKWWHKKEFNIYKLQMELIDIFHFIISNYIQDRQGDVTIATADYVEALLSGGFNWDVKDIDDGLEQLIYNAILLRDDRTSSIMMLDIFHALFPLAGMTATDVYKLYVGKNALNHFRQLNGYKEGTYSTIFKGKCDEEHLLIILNNIPSDALKSDIPSLFDYVLDKLTLRYEGVEGKETSIVDMLQKINTALTVHFTDKSNIMGVDALNNLDTSEFISIMTAILAEVPIGLVVRMDIVKSMDGECCLYDIQHVDENGESSTTAYILSLYDGQWRIVFVDDSVVDLTDVKYVNTIEEGKGVDVETMSIVIWETGEDGPQASSTYHLEKHDLGWGPVQ